MTTKSKETSSKKPTKAKACTCPGNVGDTCQCRERGIDCNCDECKDADEESEHCCSKCGEKNCGCKYCLLNYRICKLNLLLGFLIGAGFVVALYWTGVISC